MCKAVKVHNTEGKVWKEGFSLWSTGSGDGFEFGEVITPHGIVSVYREWHLRPGCTLMDFVHDGRLYSRHFEKCYSRSYVKTLAKRFVADVIEKASS